MIFSQRSQLHHFFSQNSVLINSKALKFKLLRIISVLIDSIKLIEIILLSFSLRFFHSSSLFPNLTLLLKTTTCMFECRAESIFIENKVKVESNVVDFSKGNRLFINERDVFIEEEYSSSVKISPDSPLCEMLEENDIDDFISQSNRMGASESYDDFLFNASFDNKMKLSKNNCDRESENSDRNEIQEKNENENEDEYENESLNASLVEECKPLAGILLNRHRSNALSLEEKLRRKGRRVQWPDDTGKPLTMVREYEISECDSSDESDFDIRHDCSCSIQ